MTFAVLEQERQVDAVLAERPWTLVHGDLRGLTMVIKLHGMLIDPEVSVRTALFIDQAIQRHASVILELRAWPKRHA